MKSTENFKNVIQARLDTMAAADPLFAERLKKENKNIDDCITYILNWVKQSECSGFTDEEIFGQAAHYYDEDTIDIGNPITCKVVVNHKVEPTAEEIQQAKKEALDKVMADEQERLRKKSVLTKKPEPTIVQQGSLF